jgi:hypothetical protein
VFKIGFVRLHRICRDEGRLVAFPGLLDLGAEGPQIDTAQKHQETAAGGAVFRGFGTEKRRFWLKKGQNLKVKITDQ